MSPRDQADQQRRATIAEEALVRELNIAIEPILASLDENLATPCAMGAEPEIIRDLQQLVNEIRGNLQKL